jgi:hypothetical protein
MPFSYLWLMYQLENSVMAIAAAKILQAINENCVSKAKLIYRILIFFEKNFLDQD